MHRHRKRLLGNQHDKYSISCFQKCSLSFERIEVFVALEGKTLYTLHQQTERTSPQRGRRDSNIDGEISVDERIKREKSS